MEKMEVTNDVHRRMKKKKKNRRRERKRRVFGRKINV